MSTDASPPGRRELRVTVTDEVYEQLQAPAADSRVPAEEYAARYSPTTSPAPGSSPAPSSSSPSTPSASPNTLPPPRRRRPGRVNLTADLIWLLEIAQEKIPGDPDVVDFGTAAALATWTP